MASLENAFSDRLKELQNEHLRSYIVDEKERRARILTKDIVAFTKLQRSASTMPADLARRWEESRATTKALGARAVRQAIKNRESASGRVVITPDEIDDVPDKDADFMEDGYESEDGDSSKEFEVEAGFPEDDGDDPEEQEADNGVVDENLEDDEFDADTDDFDEQQSIGSVENEESKEDIEGEGSVEDASVMDPAEVSSSFQITL